MPKNRIHTRADGRKTYKYTNADGGRRTLTQRKNEKVGAFKKRCDAADRESLQPDFDIEITFDELYQRWEAEHQFIYCQPGDIRVQRPAYESFVKPVIGHLSLGKIKRSDVIKLMMECVNSGYSQEYLSRIRQSITRPWNWAIKFLELELLCPLTGVVIKAKPRPIDTDDDSDKSGIRFITHDELEMFFSVCAGRKYENYYKVLLLTGLRPSEAAGLKLCDEGIKSLSIRRKISIDGLGKPKTRAGYREIPMTPELRAVLRDQKKRLGNNKTWFFPASSGEPSLNALDLAFRTALRQTAVWESEGRKRHSKLLRPALDFSLYDFRHTFGTRMAEVLPLKSLQVIMGHSDAATTMRYYVGFTKEAKEEATNKMTGVFAPILHPLDSKVHWAQ